MKNYSNIEGRKFNGHYVGYSADGRAWRISGQSGNWYARANVTMQGKISQIIGFERLSEISAELKGIK